MDEDGVMSNVLSPQSYPMDTLTPEIERVQVLQSYQRGGEAGSTAVADLVHCNQNHHHTRYCYMIHVGNGRHTHKHAQALNPLHLRQILNVCRCGRFWKAWIRLPMPASPIWLSGEHIDTGVLS